MVIRKQRSDKGTRRIARIQDPRVISMQMIPDDKIEGAIVKAIDKDLARLKKENPRANVKTVLIGWLSDYLGLKP